MRSSPFGALDRRLVAAPDPGRVAVLRSCDVAHRGLWGGPISENSLAGASAAIAEGYGIECDVQLSRDGTPIVFHDADAFRLCGVDRRIDTLDATEIATLRLDASEEHVPTLAALLERIDGRAPLLIEIKTEGLACAALCLAVRRTIEGYRGPVAIMGFNPNVSRWFATYAPRVLRGLVMDEKGGLRDSIRRRLAVLRARPDFIAYDIRSLPSALPTALHRRGLPVLSWTVRSDADRETVKRYADRPIFERTVG